MLTPDTVDRIAALARLDLTDAERLLFAGQLGAILDYVDQLAAVDLDDPGDANAGASAESDPSSLVLRPDIPHPSLPRDLALANAPKVVDGQIWVPAFLGEGE